MRSSGLFMHSQAVWRNFENVLLRLCGGTTSVLSAENPASVTVEPLYCWGLGMHHRALLRSVWLLCWGNVGCHRTALVPCSASAVDRCQLGPAQAGSTAVNSENCHSVFNFSICGIEILSVSAGFYLGLPCWKIKVITSKAGQAGPFFIFIFLDIPTQS